MILKQLIIENWKSIVRIELNKLNPFSVYVGANASGKSNIFEALEYIVMHANQYEVERFFGGPESFVNRKQVGENRILRINLILENFPIELGKTFSFKNDEVQTTSSQYIGLPSYFRRKDEDLIENRVEYRQFFQNFSKIFIGNHQSEKIAFEDDSKLSSAGGNLEKVLKRILKDENKRKEIVEWLQLLIPGFENLEVKSEELSGTDSLLIYEKDTDKPFPKSLISDGTYNILALLTAAYQSDKPQFLLIEEPENGLNPKVVQELVNLFRYRCEDYGDYIWLNTHSQTLVKQLTEKEIIVVEKADGETEVKQLSNGKTYGLPMDEAWLTNTFGGIPW